jgi:hypothetical protein
MNILLFLKTFWEWIIIISFILIILIRNKVRGFSWKARDGSELTLKEFFKRWGKGIEGITALQQTRTQMLGTWIVISGMLGGIIINFLIRLKDVWWWLEIILFGSLIITSMSMVGIYQKFKILKRVDNTMKEINSQNRVEKEVKSDGS